MDFTGFINYMKRGSIVRTVWALLICLSVSILSTHAIFAQDDVIAQLRVIKEPVETAASLVKANNIASATNELNEFHDGWAKIEDGIKAKSPDLYAEIELNYGTAQLALQQKQAGAATEALEQLVQSIDKVLLLDPNAANKSLSKATPAQLLGELAEAQAFAGAGDYATASSELRQHFMKVWVEVEGEIKARSPEAYVATEADVALAGNLLDQKSPEANAVLARMSARLAPIIEQGNTRYGIFDAAAILLREGLEALLVVAAILAFLVKSGNADKRGWIYGGALVGVIVSIATAAIITAVSRTAFSGSNREMMEGVISLVAAVMLFYVSYWMHGKAHANSWSKYVRTKATQAIASGSLFSLALLSFLSVFREGAETTLFYIGIMQSISMSDLLIGLGIAIAGLTLIGVLIMRYGVRLPLRPFFLVASLLVFYLGFKFVGTGIHALQVAGTLPANIASFLPSIEFIGVFPTWETTIPQLILVAIALLVILWSQRQTRRAATPA